MSYDPPIHHRRSVRLKGYDYSQPGAYHVTSVVQGRACVLGHVEDCECILSDYGRIVHEIWRSIPAHFAGVELDEFIVMPNHMHGLVIIAFSQGAKPPTLGQIVAYFKYQSTKSINLLRGTPAVRFWQRSYYDRIMRNEHALNVVRRYIAANPADWEHDPERGP